jgi:hypothetical protein
MSTSIIGHGQYHPSKFSKPWTQKALHICISLTGIPLTGDDADQKEDV